jgi:hypothetical protein
VAVHCTVLCEWNSRHLHIHEYNFCTLKIRLIHTGYKSLSMANNDYIYMGAGSITPHQLITMYMTCTKYIFSHIWDLFYIFSDIYAHIVFINGEVSFQDHNDPIPSIKNDGKTLHRVASPPPFFSQTFAIVVLLSSPQCSQYMFL